MKRVLFRLLAAAVVVLGPCAPSRSAEPPATTPAEQVLAIDLPSALRLAGAQNLDVRIAGEKLSAAAAARKVALEKFFPSIGGGIAYRRHDGAIQDVQGDVIGVGKESYTPGAVVTLQTDLGEAIFHSLEARQLVKAAGHGLDAERQRAVAAAAIAYLELVRTQAAIRSADEALRISTGYSAELDSAVKIGLAFEGDALQARAKADDDRSLQRRAQEANRIAAFRLARILDLDPAVKLVPRDAAPIPLRLPACDVPVEELVADALAARPELKQRSAEVEAAREAELGVKYGPLAPSLSGMVFAGGTGGGKDGGSSQFGDTEDYMVGLQWKLGPGGLFDLGRIEGSEARHREAELQRQRTRRAIAEEVLSARERVDSLTAQAASSETSLAASRDALRLKQQRRDFGVAAVLEAIQAQRDWTRAMDTWLATVTDLNKAQYELLRATGALGGTETASAPR